MAPSSVGGLSLLTLLAASSFAAPIAPGPGLAGRGDLSRCRDKDSFPEKWWLDCSQLGPAVTLPPTTSVWRRDDALIEGLDSKVDSIHDKGKLVHPRDEVTHLPASFIYTVNSGSGAGSSNVPQPSGNDQASGSGQGQPWGIVPEPKTVGTPKFTLPVEKPAPMVRRRERAPLDTADPGKMGADLVTHSRADAVWRRNDETRNKERSQNTEQTYSHSNNIALDSGKSEEEQLFEQSKSAHQMDSVEPKLTTMHPASDVYRRETHDTLSAAGGRSKDPQRPSRHEAEDATAKKAMDLTTLYPVSDVYRRSQDVGSVSQDDESKFRPLERTAISPLELDPPRYHPRPVPTLPRLYERDPSLRPIFNDIKDKLDKFKPKPSPGGDSESGGDTASHQSSQGDSKSSSKKRSRPETPNADNEDREKYDIHAPAVEHGPIDRAYRRNAATELDKPDKVPGKPKYVTLDRLPTVYARDDRSLDRVTPNIPTPNAHERAGQVFKRSADVHPIPFDHPLNPPTYATKQPADSVSDGGVTKRNSRDHYIVRPGTVAGNLPVVMGTALDVHRRADAVDKRCYGQSLGPDGAQLCVLEPVGEVYFEHGGKKGDVHRRE